MPPKLTDWPVRVDLTIRQGAQFRRRFTRYRDGEPVDMSDWTAVLKIRRAAGDTAAPYVVLTETDGITMGDGSVGGVLVTIAAEDTEAFTWRRGVYDLKLIDPDGVPMFLTEGVAIVRPQVSHEDPP